MLNPKNRLIKQYNLFAKNYRRLVGVVSPPTWVEKSIIYTSLLISLCYALNVYYNWGLDFPNNVMLSTSGVLGLAMFSLYGRNLQEMFTEIQTHGFLLPGDSIPYALVGGLFALGKPMAKVCAGCCGMALGFDAGFTAYSGGMSPLRELSYYNGGFQSAEQTWSHLRNFRDYDPLTEPPYRTDEKKSLEYAAIIKENARKDFWGEK